jgi:hypothetical protein
MVDFSRPVTVIVDGKKFERAVRPSLLEALASYERRRDWNLIYHARMVIDVPSSDAP